MVTKNSFKQPRIQTKMHSRVMADKHVYIEANIMQQLFFIKLFDMIHLHILINFTLL